MKQLKIIIAALFLISPFAANADPVVYTDRAEWEAAILGTISTENFDSVAPQVVGSGTTTLGLLDFTLDADDANNVNQITGTGGDNYFEGRVSNGDPSVGGPVATYIDVDFGGEVSAFGADFVSTTTGARLQFSNGSTIEFADWLPGEGTGFLGIIDSDAFSSVSFSAVRPASDGVSEKFQMDDVSWVAVFPDAGVLLEKLKADVTGVGPGRLFRRIVRRAQVYNAVPDVQSTCAVMRYFDFKVRMIGRWSKWIRRPAPWKITVEQMDDLLGQSGAIQMELGCY